jgi:hypothetical protein
MGGYANQCSPSFSAVALGSPPACGRACSHRSCKPTAARAESMVERVRPLAADCFFACLKVVRAVCEGTSAEMRIDRSFGRAILPLCLLNEKY